ncbi:DUF397 domain-containing protein [Actinomadura kijaniata]|uniref:DUF397 domain-containing protein n=1 Tax=Actinomadura kijaniata TaxID=46161 RepID=UPI00350E438A
MVEGRQGQKFVPPGDAGFLALLAEVGLRDSKDPEGPQLRVARGAFADLVGRLKERR